MKLFFGFCFSILFLSNSFSEPIITIDSTQNYQTISGWEATAEAGQLFPAFPFYKNVLFDRVVNDLGINRLRVEIASSSENPVDFFHASGSDEEHHDIVNDNSDPFRINPKGFHFSSLDNKMDTIVLPIARRLRARGEKLFLNVTYKDFGTSGFEHKNHPEEYAEFVLATYLHMRRKYQVVPDAWEVILEPDNASWSAEEIGACVLAAAKRLESYHFRPQFILPSASKMSTSLAYFERIMRFPGIRPYVYEFSYHRYNGVSNKTLRTIAKQADSFRMRTAMLEHIGSGYEDLHRDLKMGSVSSWQQYTLAFPGTEDTGGKYYLLDVTNPQSPVVLTAPRTNYLQQYFHYIRRGAIRIGATTTSAEFNPVAFINKNRRYVAVVKVAHGGKFSLFGLPAGKYGITYTTSSEAAASLPDIATRSGTISTRIPSRGVITIFQK